MELKVLKYGEFEIIKLDFLNDEWFCLEDICEIFKIDFDEELLEKLNKNEKLQVCSLNEDLCITLITKKAIGKIVKIANNPEAIMFFIWVMNRGATKIIACCNCGNCH